MLSAEAGCLFVGLILYISGVHGQSNKICALKGSSVDLPCSAEHPINWYTVHWNVYEYIRRNVSADGNRVMYNVSEEGNVTLRVSDLRENDADYYCCGQTTDTAGHCWFYRTELHVADLQVKVIPTTEGQTVTLMCSTSCPLTENPAAYIWYKNREFLYQDWSPWYQQLVSSEEAVNYSCAIKGYEDLRAPEVSVDSVTSTCFTVTYAKGTMCSYKETSVDEPCSITYPKEVHVQRTPLDEHYHVRLTCTPSCALTDPQTTYRWYWRDRLYRYTVGRHLTVVDGKGSSCAVKGHEDLHSATICPHEHCNSVNYVSRRICAVERSSVNISSKYSQVNRLNVTKIWYKIKRRDEDDDKMEGDTGRLEYHDDQYGNHILRITNLTRNDSAEYKLRLFEKNEKSKRSDLPGVTLVVTGLNVTMTPSAVVTEGQRVTLTCSTSCPLTDNTKYTWYLDSRPLTLPQNQNKHLLLDPVSSQHAGNYSCAVKTHKTNIISDGKTLIVQAEARGNSMPIINAMRLVVALLIPIPLLLFHLWLSRTYSMGTSQSSL